MTASEVDAAITAALAKLHRAGAELPCEQQVGALRRAAADGFVELNQDDPASFDAGDALLAALCHDRMDVVRHGALAFRELSMAAETAVLRMVTAEERALLPALRSAVDTADGDVCSCVLEGLNAMATRPASSSSAAGARTASENTAATAAAISGESEVIAALVQQHCVEIIVVAAKHIPQRDLGCAVRICGLLLRVAEHVKRVVIPRAMRDLVAAGAARVVAACLSFHGRNRGVAGTTVRLLCLLSHNRDELTGKQLLDEGACEAAIAVCRDHLEDAVITADACEAVHSLAATHFRVALHLIRLGAPQTLVDVLESCKWPAAGRLTAAAASHTRKCYASAICALSVLATAVARGAGNASAGAQAGGCDYSHFVCTISPLAASVREYGAQLEAHSAGRAHFPATEVLVACRTILPPAIATLELISRDASMHDAMIASGAGTALVDELNRSLSMHDFGSTASEVAAPSLTVFARLAESASWLRSVESGRCYFDDSDELKVAGAATGALALFTNETIDDMTQMGVGHHGKGVVRSGYRALHVLAGLPWASALAGGDVGSVVARMLDGRLSAVFDFVFDAQAASYAAATIAKLFSRGDEDVLHAAGRAATLGALVRVLGNHSEDAEAAARAALGIQDLCALQLPATAMYVCLRGVGRALALAARHDGVIAAETALAVAPVASGPLQVAAASLSALAAMARHAFNRPALIAEGAVEAVLIAVWRHLDDATVCSAACDVLQHLLLTTLTTSAASGSGPASPTYQESAAGSHAANFSDSGSCGDSIHLLLEVLRRHAGTAAVEVCALRALAHAVLPQSIGASASLAAGAAARRLVEVKAAAHAAIQRTTSSRAVVSSAALLLQMVSLGAVQPTAVTGSGAGMTAGAGAGSAGNAGGSTPTVTAFALAAGLGSADSDSADVETGSHEARVQMVVAASMRAAMHGNSETLRACTQPSFAPAVEWDVVLEIAADAGHQAAVDVILTHIAVHAVQGFPRRLDDALMVSIARGHEELSEHLLRVWRPQPSRWANSRGFKFAPLWAAAGARSARTLDALLHRLRINESGAASGLLADGSVAAARADNEVVSCAAGSGDLTLLTSLLADPHLDNPLLPQLGDADDAARECSRANRIAVVQCMLLDPRADPDAAGQAALAAAAAGGHISVLEALLEDPRVTAPAFAVPELTRRAPAAGSATDRLMMRQPSVLRALALPLPRGPALPVVPLQPYTLTASDAAEMAAAAWRRRRAAVLSWHWVRFGWSVPAPGCSGSATA